MNALLPAFIAKFVSSQVNPLSQNKTGVLQVSKKVIKNEEKDETCESNDPSA